jgi:hypothetical protein
MDGPFSSSIVYQIKLAVLYQRYDPHCTFLSFVQMRGCSSLLLKFDNSIGGKLLARLRAIPSRALMGQTTFFTLLSGAPV